MMGLCILDVSYWVRLTLNNAHSIRPECICLIELITIYFTVFSKSNAIFDFLYLLTLKNKFYFWIRRVWIVLNNLILIVRRASHNLNSSIPRVQRFIWWIVRKFRAWYQSWRANGWLPSPVRTIRLKVVP